MRGEDGSIRCDKCGCWAEAKSDERAESAGWLVDRRTTPESHICPACREAAVGS